LRQAEGAAGRDLGTAAAAAQRVERLLERKAPLDGLRSFLPPGDFHAKALEAERAGPVDLRVVRLAAEPISRLARLARRAQDRFGCGTALQGPSLSCGARAVGPSIVECKLSCH
jgi:hypothetical protein